jgi:hypothetical protein
MRTAAASEEDKRAKAALFARYAQSLPAAQAGWSARGFGLLLDLLRGMRDVMRGDPVGTHQTLFKGADCFVQARDGVSHSERADCCPSRSCFRETFRVKSLTIQKTWQQNGRLRRCEAGYLACAST